MGKFLENNLIDSMDANSKGTILRSMAIFTAIELCGSFLTGKTGPRTTENNFLTFCKSKYVQQNYHQISELLYSMFRNGVSHSYIPKGAALLSSHPSGKNCHLKFFNNGLCIYVPQFAEDITQGVKEFIRDLKSDSDNQLQKRYYRVLEKLNQMGKKEYDNFIKLNKIKTIKIKNFNRDIDIKI